MPTAQPITFDGETYYPMREAARLLGWSLDQLYTHVRQGKVRASTGMPKRIAHAEIRRVLNGEPLPTPAWEQAHAEERQRKHERDVATLKDMGY